MKEITQKVIQDVLNQYNLYYTIDRRTSQAMQSELAIAKLGLQQGTVLAGMVEDAISKTVVAAATKEEVKFVLDAIQLHNSIKSNFRVAKQTKPAKTPEKSDKDKFNYAELGERTAKAAWVTSLESSVDIRGQHKDATPELIAASARNALTKLSNIDSLLNVITTVNSLLPEEDDMGEGKKTKTEEDRRKIKPKNLEEALNGMKAEMQKVATGFKAKAVSTIEAVNTDWYKDESLKGIVIAAKTEIESINIDSATNIISAARGTYEAALEDAKKQFEKAREKGKEKEEPSSIQDSYTLQKFVAIASYISTCEDCLKPIQNPQLVNQANTKQRDALATLVQKFIQESIGKPGTGFTIEDFVGDKIIGLIDNNNEPLKSKFTDAQLQRFKNDIFDRLQAVFATPSNSRPAYPLNGVKTSPRIESKFESREGSSEQKGSPDRNASGSSESSPKTPAKFAEVAVSTNTPENSTVAQDNLTSSNGRLRRTVANRSLQTFNTDNIEKRNSLSPHSSPTGSPRAQNTQAVTSSATAAAPISSPVIAHAPKRPDRPAPLNPDLADGLAKSARELNPSNAIAAANAPESPSKPVIKPAGSSVGARMSSTPKPLPTPPVTQESFAKVASPTDSSANKKDEFDDWSFTESNPPSQSSSARSSRSNSHGNVSESISAPKSEPRLSTVIKQNLVEKDDSWSGSERSSSSSGEGEEKKEVNVPQAVVRPGIRRLDTQESLDYLGIPSTPVKTNSNSSIVTENAAAKARQLSAIPNVVASKQTVQSRPSVEVEINSRGSNSSISSGSSSESSSARSSHSGSRITHSSDSGADDESYSSETTSRKSSNSEKTSPRIDAPVINNVDTSDLLRRGSTKTLLSSMGVSASPRISNVSNEKQAEQDKNSATADELLNSLSEDTGNSPEDTPALLKKFLSNFTEQQAKDTSNERPVSSTPVFETPKNPIRATLTPQTTKRLGDALGVPQDVEGPLWQPSGLEEGDYPRITTPRSISDKSDVSSSGISSIKPNDDADTIAKKVLARNETRASSLSSSTPNLSALPAKESVLSAASQSTSLVEEFSNTAEKAEPKVTPILRERRSVANLVESPARAESPSRLSISVSDEVVVRTPVPSPNISNKQPENVITSALPNKEEVDRVRSGSNINISGSIHELTDRNSPELPNSPVITVARGERKSILPDFASPEPKAKATAQQNGNVASYSAATNPFVYPDSAIEQRSNARVTATATIPSLKLNDHFFDSESEEEPAKQSVSSTSVPVQQDNKQPTGKINRSSSFSSNARSSEESSDDEASKSVQRSKKSDSTSSSSSQERADLGSPQTNAAESPILEAAILAVNKIIEISKETLKAARDGFIKAVPATVKIIETTANNISNAVESVKSYVFSLTTQKETRPEGSLERVLYSGEERPQYIKDILEAKQIIKELRAKNPGTELLLRRHINNTTNEVVGFSIRTALDGESPRIGASKSLDTNIDVRVDVKNNLKFYGDPFTSKDEANKYCARLVREQQNTNLKVVGRKDGDQTTYMVCEPLAKNKESVLSK
ncbi:MAG: hypothetical protein K0R98_604 [Rickettsiaceae bacterium]|jgi:hypothetical protein|nr:hypothetical protein [Rickettsiaceae bacterium]